MLRDHLQCAEEQDSPSHLTKYCACHAKRLSWFIALTYETSFTMRGATGIALTPHQILCLPRKLSVLIDRAHIWNVIYNARSNRHHPPNSPNRAPASRNRAPKSKTKRNLPKTVEVSFFQLRDRSDATCLATEGTSRARRAQILLKITTFPAPAIIPNFTKCCACHEKWHMNFTKCCTW